MPTSVVMTSHGCPLPARRRNLHDAVSVTPPKNPYSKSICCNTRSGEGAVAILQYSEGAMVTIPGGGAPPDPAAHLRTDISSSWSGDPGSAETNVIEEARRNCASPGIPCLMPSGTTTFDR